MTWKFDAGISATPRKDCWCQDRMQNPTKGGWSEHFETDVNCFCVILNNVFELNRFKCVDDYDSKTGAFLPKLVIPCQSLVQSLVCAPNFQENSKRHKFFVLHDKICFTQLLWTSIKCADMPRAKIHMYLNQTSHTYSVTSPVTSPDPQFCSK